LIAGWLTTVNENQAELVAISNSLINAKGDLASAEKSVNHKLAALAETNDGADELDIAQKRVAVRQKEKAYNDCFLTAPFDGLITRLDLEVGELASAGTSVASMISDSQFEIETFVPEISIAGLAIGNSALITLDAYGENEEFEARVVSVAPAETIRDGVSTFKVVLAFVKDDERIRSGLTANVLIVKTDRKNVISVPGSAIGRIGGKKYVQIKSGRDFTWREVLTGEVVSLGQTEILSGLKEGDIVRIYFTE